jgi:heme/copper-type cytochrome/quinol oxidase subunit 1
VFVALSVAGLILLVTALLIVLGDTGGMSRRMPTQVPPRRIALYPLVAGVVALVIGAAGIILP